MQCPLRLTLLSTLSTRNVTTPCLWDLPASITLLDFYKFAASMSMNPKKAQHDSGDMCRHLHTVRNYINYNSVRESFLFDEKDYDS